MPGSGGCRTTPFGGLNPLELVWALKSEQWEPIAETWETIIHPADCERAASAARLAAELGQEIEVEWRLKLPEGEPERWFLTRGRPIAKRKWGLGSLFRRHH